ncbi:winged helix-turn-helix domain-containing protein [Paenibacillus donghaensis]|uniref:Transcriptional regulator n=1 Tax=Paenibacillus donghaensis TaxID=414771 RepID=A0A2Z2K893_9BACL|nr:winged helix-turn-helix domain-containing protein [Paenibacillus donghaensis]ASA19455.1 transcriptional regulator [Paenibacillus donghaensis]
MRLELHEGEYKVSEGDAAVVLLPKEFALLQFLNRNRGLAFSREQLLDQVWPLEYPVERTVDDHIYRLRKKLAELKHVQIKTIRGFGYSLSIRDANPVNIRIPAVQDTELQETLLGVLGKYHLYGQGRSMLTLAGQQDILGYELDPFYLVCTHFVGGDLQWLLDTDEVGLGERLYYLLLFYIFSGDPSTKLALCEQVLAKHLLSGPQHTELKILNILDLYALAGEPDKALERLKLTYKVIAGPGYENFIPVTAISELFVHLIAGTADEQLEQLARRIDGLLLAQPFLREIGSYHAVKGMWHVRRGAWKEAEELLDEGLQVLEMSGFVPMQLYALHRIVHYCNSVPCKEALRRKYKGLLEEALERVGLNRLLQPLEERLHDALLAL